MAASQDRATRPKHSFKLKYAARLDRFTHIAGEDPIDQIRFMADVGFAALEDSLMQQRTVQLQEKIGSELLRLGMQMGTFIATAEFQRPTFTSGKPEFREQVLNDMRAAIAVAKRLGAKWFTVVPGKYDTGLPEEKQTANVVELLKRCCELCEPAGVVMVIEPLNHLVDHPGVFLQTVSQALAICRQVQSPSCKILDDLYHQQITEGNLIHNLDMAWEEIAYIQVGDVPGRKEPTTGEINYKNVFRHLHEKGYQGLIGMEHGMAGDGPAGEQAVIDAYAEVDPA